MKKETPGILPVYCEKAPDGSVIVWRDPARKEKFCVFAAHNSRRPRKNSKMVNINCYAWQVVWLENTVLSYHYRDASNYKAHDAIVVAGKIAFADLAPYLDNITDNAFIPSQVGMKDLQPTMISFPSADDHVFHSFEYGEDDFAPTSAAPTVDFTAAELIERFKKAKQDGWNISAALDRLGIIA